MNNLSGFKKGIAIATSVATIAWSVGVTALPTIAFAQAAIADGDYVKVSGTAGAFETDKTSVFKVSGTILAPVPDGSMFKAANSSVCPKTDAWPSACLALLKKVSKATLESKYSLGAFTPSVPAVYKVGTDYYAVTATAVAKLSAATDADKASAYTARAIMVSVLLSLNDSDHVAGTATDAAAAGVGTGTTVVQPPTPTGGAVSVEAGASIAGGSVVADSSGTSDGAQSLISALNLVFKAGSVEAQVNSLILKRGGISSDTSIDRVYLYDGDTRLAENSSLSLGVITFTNSTGLFKVAAGASKTITVKFDLGRSATSGQQITLALEGANKVTLAGGGSATLTPASGLVSNTFTVATVTDLGRLAVTNVSPSAATNIDAGLLDTEVWRYTFQSFDQPLKVSHVKVTFTGSIQATDLTNIKLYDGGLPAGTPVVALASDKTATFDLSAKPLEIASGVTKTMTVRANIVAGSSRTYRGSIQNSSDVKASDTTYGVSIVPNGNATWSVVQAGGDTTINTGSATLTRASAAPSGNIALNATNQKIAEYDVKAVGEAIKVTTLSGTITSAATNIRNVRFEFDGSQVGTTQNTFTTGGTAVAVSTNFTIPADGANHKIAVYSDIASVSGTALASGNTILFTLTTGSSNGQRQNALTTLNVPTANQAANTLTVTSASLSASLNTTFAAPTVVRGAIGVQINSWLLTASAEDINVNSVSVIDRNAGDTANGAQGLGNAFDALTLKVGTEQAGQTINSPSSTAGTTQTFNLSTPVLVRRGGSVKFDLYANVLNSETWTDGDAFKLSAASGTGVSTSTSVSLVSGTNGRGVTIQTAGQLSLAVESLPATAQYSMTPQGGAASEVTLGAWKFGATNREAITLEQLIVQNTHADFVLEAGDEATTSWSVVNAAVTAVAAASIADGRNGIRCTEAGTSAVADACAYDFGTGASSTLLNYTHVGFWIRSSAAKAAGDLTVDVNNDNDNTSNEFSGSIPALTANTSQYVSLALTGVTAAGDWIRFKVAANPDNSGVIDIDGITFFNIGSNYRNLKLYADGVQQGNTCSSLDPQYVYRCRFTGLNVGVPQNGFKIVTLKAETTDPTNASLGRATRFTATLPASVTSAIASGLTTDDIIARGSMSGQYVDSSTAAATATASNANAMYAVRSKLTASVNSASPSGTGKTRAANDVVFKVDVKADPAGEVQVRGGLQNSAEAAGTATALNSWRSSGTNLPVAAAVSTTAVEGTNSITSAMHATTAAVGDGISYQPTTALDLSGYNGVCFWVRSSATTAAADLTFSLHESAVIATGAGVTFPAAISGASVSLPVLVANDWRQVCGTFSANTALRDAVTYYVLRVAANAATFNNVSLFIDDVRFFKDYIQVTVAGTNLSNVASTAPPLITALDASSGVTIATGYFNGDHNTSTPTTLLLTSGSIYLIPVSGAAGDSGQNSASNGDFVTAAGVIRTVNIRADTTLLLTASGTLSMQIGLGTSASTLASSPGGILWFDNNTPITTSTTAAQTGIVVNNSGSLTWVDATPAPVQGGSLSY